MHELHTWRLSQNKAIASAHVVTSEVAIIDFMKQTRLISECLHAYGIHSATLQPEFATASESNTIEVPSSIRQRSAITSACQITCGALCEELTCCG